MRFTLGLLMTTHNICFLREIRKKSIFRQVNLAWTVDFDSLLVHGKVIKFDNSTKAMSHLFQYGFIQWWLMLLHVFTWNMFCSYSSSQIKQRHHTRLGIWFFIQSLVDAIAVTWWTISVSITIPWSIHIGLIILPAASVPVHVWLIIRGWKFQPRQDLEISYISF